MYWTPSRHPARADTDTSGEYALRLDIANAEISGELVSDIAILLKFLSASAVCGSNPSVQKLAGALRVYAKIIFAAPLKAILEPMGISPYTNGNGTVLENGTSLFALPAATSTTLDSVKVWPGSGLTVDSSGNLALDTAIAGDMENIFKYSNG